MKLKKNDSALYCNTNSRIRNHEPETSAALFNTKRKIIFFLDFL